ncbi:MAG: S8 family serine peptidase [Phycisphaerae bacterium]|nr:S8 family serine peptidase [Phycisphaerae bacterium]
MLIVLFGVLVCGSAPATADTGPIYYARGRAYGLLESQTELAVEFAATMTAAQGGVAGLVEESAGGTIRPVPWGRADSQFRILEVPAVTPSVIQAARSTPGVASVNRVYRFVEDNLPSLGTGKIVVKLGAGMTASERQSLFDEYGVQLVNAIEGLSDVYVVQPVDNTPGAEVAIAADLYRDGRTLYSHPDFRNPKRLHQGVDAPQDVYFSQQWHLSNTGQQGGTPGADIDVLEAWKTTEGAAITIGMFDDACDLAHEDLEENYTGESHNASTDVTDETAALPSGLDERHGTAVMGLAVAAANDLGVRGVAPSARFTASRGVGDLTTGENESRVFLYARQAGVAVHINSWGFVLFPTPDVVADAIRVAFQGGRNGLGMVVLFSSGNENLENDDTEISALPTVISVGASDADDTRATYSNYGESLDILAPSGDDYQAGMVTTDNTDAANYVDPGYNRGTEPDDLEDPNYTKYFSGTSASCPVAAGVAALVLSANPKLTATQVRTVLEHTAERVSPTKAEYNAITRKSLKYGFGRVNAAGAVAAATESKSNKHQTWPEPVRNVSVSGTTLLWQRNDDLRTETGSTETRGDVTVGTLVVQSNSVFAWVPEDGETYEVGQEVADGVSVVVNSNVTSYTFSDERKLFFAIFARNSRPHYSWGVTVDSDGNVVNPGSDTGGDDGGGDEGPITPIPLPTTPEVSISATPLAGNSPLLVEFRGNARTDSNVVSRLWDFGDGTTDPRGTATHTYRVAEGASQTFTATFTVTDSEGDEGSKSVQIQVQSAGSTNGNDNTSTEDATVSIRMTDSKGAVLNSTSTYPVPLRVYFEAQVNGFPAGSIVTWYFGDGTAPVQASSAVHDYTVVGSFPVTLVVSSVLTSGSTLERQATTIIQTSPTGNGNDNDNDNSVLPPVSGSRTSGTCGVGILLPFAGVVLMSLWRRRFR